MLYIHIFYIHKELTTFQISKSQSTLNIQQNYMKITAQKAFKELKFLISSQSQILRTHTNKQNKT